MKRFVFFGLLGIFSFLSVSSQTDQAFPALGEQDLPGAKFSPARTFNGESLYGYIDGGADLYLEYGFTGVMVTELTRLKGKYKIEIYKMNNPESAYGIFSVSRFRCRTRPAIADYTCQNKYQLQICSGSYYISVINESGTGADSAAAIMIGKKIVEKLSEPSADLSPFFPGIPVETVRNESYMVKGRLGVINGAPDTEKYLKGLEGYTALILNTPVKILISIRFNDKRTLEKFGASHNWEIEKISELSHKMRDGETVRKLNENHVLIEIPSAK